MSSGAASVVVVLGGVSSGAASVVVVPGEVSSGGVLGVSVAVVFAAGTEEAVSYTHLPLPTIYSV